MVSDSIILKLNSREWWDKMEVSGCTWS